ncbi:peptidase [Rhizobium rhizosphaerae]|uniref:Peptidase n=1 Tax=Xaviernesmea rhizosphaerae TaxID=1672749 RepID=A0A1Q9AM61_9HYPH|nr:CocE/NonD family hydrolase [Xaviernesmea rhizosphaerae]OLP56494.1 peptidase [Xaviernesmea rhizosphaerae]
MSARGFTVIENEWIRLKDGTRLAARIWMPDNAGDDPVPAVLEYLPYRKQGGTSLRDESTYPVFAAAGIAGVRVDIRGSGESEGVIDGEYTPRELSDGYELVEWIAAQPWSNGRVGMMGISWGGFNCLQVAALKPPALKAVISIASTVDRYNDDIHYKDGTHLSAQLSWAATMLGYQSRSPDPALVGDAWKAMWLERLEGEPFFLEEWLAHPHRDAFWQHGSICEDFDGFPVPALVIAGWADGYRNTPIKAVEGLGPKAKAMIGPWVHKYPHFAWPKPRADFHGEAIAWWNRWLRDEDNGAEALPQMRAFILDGPRPALRRAVEPGFWIAKQDWQAPEMQSFHVGPYGALTQGLPVPHPQPHAIFLRSPLDTGTQSGEWFTLKPDAEMAGDQRLDDAGSLTFETEPFAEGEAYLGRPEVTLTLTPHAPVANLIVRLVDLHPDGAATRITFGVLNLCHRDGNAAPTPLVPGAPITVRLVLDACGYRIGEGHRLRIALSTAYWPMILPTPEDAGITIDAATLGLAMPLLGDHERITVPEPENPDPLPHYTELSPGRTERRVERDLATGTTRYIIVEDTGLFRHPDTGLAIRDLREECWSITQGDPLSMTGVSTWTCVTEREGWSARTVSTSRLACTRDEWLTSAEVTAFEGDSEIFAKRFEKRIPRALM